MGEFWRAALDFPAVLFGPALVVAVIYWLFALVGGDGADISHGGGDVGTAARPTRSLVAKVTSELRGAPIPVVLTLLLAIAWFLSLVVTVLLSGTLLRTLALPVVLAGSWYATRAALRTLRRFTRQEQGITHAEFVGRMCVVRTGRVDDRFGQAEVAAPDGSTALIQVRAEGSDAAHLAAGTNALIYDYDAGGGFFRIAAHDAF